MSISVSEKKIKSKIKIGDRVAVTENIKYPFFEGEKNDKLCRRMNAFYSSVAEKYSYHARKKLPQRINIKKHLRKLPLAVSMNYNVAFCGESIISVVLDLAFTSGKTVKMRRFSQMWSTEKSDIEPLSDVLETDRKSQKKLYSLVLALAGENIGNPAFGYYDDCLSALRKSFDVRNCFAVPNGLCFFVDAGILAPVKYGPSNFVVPYNTLEDILKGGFMAKNGKKTEQRENIVNNI